ncbi:MAG: hypothetical protein ACC707_20965, partial [Thiohalomonadales bacterium]
IEPIEIAGRKIAQTFWGQAWCGHLEQFGDYANRLPRGRTYVRNGSVCHLGISKGKVDALVSGSEIYNVVVNVTYLSASRWRKVRAACAGQIGSMLELLQGQLSEQVMAVVSDTKNGLFPNPHEIDFSCDCPDWAEMCKHVAAVLYGIGARLDHRPELLFLLRGVDHQELISTELDVQVATSSKGKTRRLATQDMAGLFGIDIDVPPSLNSSPLNKKPSGKKSAAKKGGTTKKLKKVKKTAKKLSSKKVTSKKSSSKKILKKKANATAVSKTRGKKKATVKKKASKARR